MKYILAFFFIFVNSPVFSEKTLNGTYLICEKTEEYSNKEKHKNYENFMFIFLKQKIYDQKKIIKKKDGFIVSHSFKLFNTGKYEFKEKSIQFIDSLKFREKKFKRNLNRNTMILQTKYKDNLMFEHFCNVTDLKKFDDKHASMIDKLKKFWKNKHKDNKI